jgi:hypothetical protein
MFSGKDDTVRLEGLDVELRGHRVLVVGEPDTWLTRFNALESEALYKGRNILVIHESVKGSGREYPLLYRRRWDAVFRIRESFDAQMMLTYVQNAAKPIRILWVFSPNATLDIPRAMWQRWVKNDITLIGATETGAIGGVEWEAILFPLQCEFSRVERILNARASGISIMLSKLRDHISEIAASGAALAWTNIEEKDSKGGLYWYDPSEGSKGTEDSFTKKEASELLQSLSLWIGKN